MSNNLYSFEPDFLDKALRVVVVLAGVGALGAAALSLVEVGLFLVQAPQTSAEAHAMAHSAPGVLVALVFGVGGFGLAGTILLTVAYVDRRRLSAVTLVVTGFIGLHLVGGRVTEPVVAVPLTMVVFGGYALYADATGRGPFRFIAGATSLLWFAELLLIVIFALDLMWALGLFVPVFSTLWIQHVLAVGALGIFAAAGWNQYHERAIPRPPVVLAAAVLLPYLPEAVRDPLSGYAFLGLDPITWTQVFVATGAALAILAGAFNTVPHPTE